MVDKEKIKKIIEHFNGLADYKSPEHVHLPEGTDRQLGIKEGQWARHERWGLTR